MLIRLIICYLGSNPIHSFYHQTFWRLEQSVHLLHYIKKLVTFFFFCSICSKIPINDLWPTFQNTQIEEVLAVDCREVDSGTGKGYSQYKAREAFLYCMIETTNFVATKSGKSATIAMKQKLPWSMTTFHNAAAKLSLGCASHTSCTKFPRGQAELPQVTLTCQSRCLKTVSIPYKMKNPITIIWNDFFLCSWPSLCF